MYITFNHAHFLAHHLAYLPREFFVNIQFDYVNWSLSVSSLLFFHRSIQCVIFLLLPFFSFKRFLMLFLFLCVKNLCSIGSWNGSNSHGSRCSVQYFLDGHLIFLRCPINDYILIGYHTLSISRSFLKEHYWLTKFYWAQ